MKSFKFKIDGKAYEVSVEEKETNKVEVQLNGKTISVEMEGEETPVKRTVVPKKALAAPASGVEKTVAQPASKPAGGLNSIKAPIPGVIFKIEVSVGQEVKRGAVLLVMESMKMENNILANRDGVIKAIHVNLGESVLQGNALIDLE
jgi:biotin carboxyl carrier protein